MIYFGHKIENGILGFNIIKIVFPSVKKVFYPLETNKPTKRNTLSSFLSGAIISGQNSILITGSQIYTQEQKNRI